MLMRDCTHALMVTVHCVHSARCGRKEYVLVSGISGWQAGMPEASTSLPSYVVPFSPIPVLLLCPCPCPRALPSSFTTKTLRLFSTTATSRRSTGSAVLSRTVPHHTPPLSLTSSLPNPLPTPCRAHVDAGLWLPLRAQHLRARRRRLHENGPLLIHGLMDSLYVQLQLGGTAIHRMLELGPDVVGRLGLSLIVWGSACSFLSL